MKYFISLILSLFTGITYAANTEVKPINNFESGKYLGTWYEIARLPNSFENSCFIPITANYSINPDDNTQIIVVNQCYTANGNPNSAQGVASYVDTPSLGKLKVTFLPKWLRFLPFGSGDYWILYTDYVNISVVGSPNHKYLWILARSQEITRNQLNQALKIAKDQGFDTHNLIFNYVGK